MTSLLFALVLGSTASHAQTYATSSPCSVSSPDYGSAACKCALAGDLTGYWASGVDWASSDDSTRGDGSCFEWPAVASTVAGSPNKASILSYVAGRGDDLTARINTYYGASVTWSRFSEGYSLTTFEEGDELTDPPITIAPIGIPDLWDLINTETGDYLGTLDSGGEQPVHAYLLPGDQGMPGNLLITMESDVQWEVQSFEPGGFIIGPQ